MKEEKENSFFMLNSEVVHCGNDCILEKYFVNFENGKFFHEKSFYNDEEDEWEEETMEEITLEELLNNKTELEKKWIKKAIELKRPLNGFESLQNDFPNIVELLKEFGKIEDVEYNFLEDEEKFVSFYLENKHYYLISESEYLKNKKDFEDEFKEEVERTNNFENFQFKEIYYAFENRPGLIEKEYLIDNVKYILESHRISNEFDEVEIMVKEYIKKHNIKILDPESLEE